MLANLGVNFCMFEIIVLFPLSNNWTSKHLKLLCNISSWSAGVIY
jgi:hypothetical protein